MRPWSGLTIAGFFCGVSSLLFWLLMAVSVVLSILSILFMVAGLRDVSRRAARGSALAVFGGVFGIMALVGWIIGWVGAAVS